MLGQRLILIAIISLPPITAGCTQLNFQGMQAPGHEAPFIITVADCPVVAHPKPRKLGVEWDLPADHPEQVTLLFTAAAGTTSNIGFGVVPEVIGGPNTASFTVTAGQPVTVVLSFITGITGAEVRLYTGMNNHVVPYLGAYRANNKTELIQVTPYEPTGNAGEHTHKIFVHYHGMLIELIVT